MANLNKVMIMGNLTRDVELKQIPNGQQVAQIGLALNRRFKTKEGEDREEVTFVDCEAWGRQAEVIAQYMSKGKPIFIEGRLKLDTWEDKDGKKQSKMRVVVEDFQFIGARDGAGSGGGGANTEGGAARGNRGGGGGGDYAPAPRENRPTGGHVAVPEDDIPF
ncbi:MAG: single-stranded DNA-binding protein [Phycisphaerae bacterium]|nr:single-stranded DNA-binding protein [Phycisphaerae bacterium]